MISSSRICEWTDLFFCLYLGGQFSSLTDQIYPFIEFLWHVKSLSIRQNENILSCSGTVLATPEAGLSTCHFLKRNVVIATAFSCMIHACVKVTTAVGMARKAGIEMSWRNFTVDHCEYLCSEDACTNYLCKYSLFYMGCCIHVCIDIFTLLKKTAYAG